MSRIRAVLLIALAGAACATVPQAAGTPGGGLIGDARADARLRGGVTLRTDALEYARGAGVLLTLVNETDRWVALDPCGATLERFADGRWVAVAAAADACVPSAGRVAPRAFARHAQRLPTVLEPGRFRYRHEVEEGGTMSYITVISNTFTVH
jgi:hypothetical protein